MDIVSVGPVSGGPDALRREFAAVGSRVDGPKLAIVYLPFDVDHAAYLAAASEGIGGPVVGATTAGAAFTERGFSTTDPVGAVLSGRGFSYSISVASDLSRDPATAVRTAARRLVDAAHRTSARSQVLLTLADGFACDGEVLYGALQQSVPPHWRMLGTNAGGGQHLQQAYVFAGREILRDAAILIGLFSDSAPSLVAHHGWRGVDGSAEMTVTEVEGNILRRLDDRPALEAYRAELIRLGCMRDGDDFMSVTATHELGMRTMFGDQLKIRAAMAVGEDGAIKLASAIPVGAKVCIATASADELIEAARTLSSRALEPFERQALHGALVFDCGARLQRLGARYGEEVTAFSGGRHFPLVGVAGYGEIAKFAGSIDGFHNATAVMAVW